MWSKTRQVLESRLCLELTGRVQFHYDVYRTNRDRENRLWFTEMNVFSILVDGEAWFSTNPQYYIELYRSDMSHACPQVDKNEVIRKFGYVPASDVSSDSVMFYVHRFLNELSFEESLNNENYFIRLLALLDKRLGKRRIKALADVVDSEPEWFRKWIRLRMEAFTVFP